jgi:hypothetical protein
MASVSREANVACRILAFSREVAGYTHDYDGPTDLALAQTVPPPVSNPDRQGNRYWAFQCRPDNYDAAAAIARQVDDTLFVDRSRPEPGDKALIWQFAG